MEIVRVLQVFTVMNIGGSESMIMNYYRKIDRTKVQFDFLVHRSEKGVFDDEIEELGGKIYRLSPINPFNPKNYYEELRGFFKQHYKYSIVHAHLNTFSYFVLKIAKEFKIPYRIAHAHTATEPIKFVDLLNPSTLKESLKKAVKFRLKRRIHDNTTHYFSCGKKAGDWLFGEKTNFEVLNNSIDAKKFIYNATIAKEYKTNFHINDQYVIGHIGNFTHPKNHNFLIELFNNTLKVNKNCVLVLIGSGPLKSSIEKKATELNIKDKVLFLGARRDIPELCQMMDLFVFPSLYEGLPVTLIEAQSSGLKIVASNTITEEVSVTNDINFLPLNKPNIWVNEILKNTTYKRKNNFKLIEKSGYDIETSVLFLQNYYLKLNNN